MVDFETIKADVVEFGNNNFIEVAKKKAVSEDGENTFISLSRGFKTPTGERRYKKSFTIPLDDAVVDFVCKTIMDVKDADGGAAPAEAPKEEAPAEEAVEEAPKEESAE